MAAMALSIPTHTFPKSLATCKAGSQVNVSPKKSTVKPNFPEQQSLWCATTPSKWQKKLPLAL